MSIQTGTSLGPYEILAPLGAGGMGEVYRARDTRLGREVAVKVISESLADNPTVLARFELEARAVAALSHPNILALFDVGREGGVAYAVMELLEGETLRQRLAGGPLPATEAQKIALQIAAGLAAAHEKGIVHRDLKPGNVFLTRTGPVKILDFGLAKQISRADSKDLSEALTGDSPTRAGAILGTAGYMAPEQVRGLPADARSDVFAFGVVLHEMLSGKNPFERTSEAEVLAAVLKEEPSPLSGGTPPELAEAVQRCLQKDPAGRFQSATDLRDALEDRGSVPAPHKRPTIAVFPFTNMMGIDEEEYFCEGLAEEIINELTRISGLRVIARTSSFAVARLGLEMREAGAKLGAENILEGSVRRAGNRVRISTQLASARDGTEIWGARYDREMTDVLALEAEIAAAIATKLRVELERGESRRERPATNPEAHAAYLEGRYHFAKQTPPALAQAKACFEAAIARDPAFALAYDSMAELLWYFGFFGHVPPREAFSQSTWFALRALELDDSLAQTHALLGMLRKELDYNWPEVERECRRGLELNPESQPVRLRYAISHLLPHGRVTEGMEEMERILVSDPLSLFVRWWMAIFAYLARRPERAIAEGRTMVNLDPSHFLGHWSLGIGLAESGLVREAVPKLQTAHELSGGAPFTLGFLACFSGIAGMQDVTRSLLEQAERMVPARYLPPSTLALCHLGLGEIDEVFHALDQAIEARDPIIMPIKTFPFLDPLRSDPRFQGLLRKMGLQDGVPRSTQGA